MNEFKIFYTKDEENNEYYVEGFNFSGATVYQVTFQGLTLIGEMKNCIVPLRLTESCISGVLLDCKPSDTINITEFPDFNLDFVINFMISTIEKNVRYDEALTKIINKNENVDEQLLQLIAGKLSTLSERIQHIESFIFKLFLACLDQECVFSTIIEHNKYSGCKRLHNAALLTALKKESIETILTKMSNFDKELLPACLNAITAIDSNFNFSSLLDFEINEEVKEKIYKNLDNGYKECKNYISFLIKDAFECFTIIPTEKFNKKKFKNQLKLEGALLEFLETYHESSVFDKQREKIEQFNDKLDICSAIIGAKNLESLKNEEIELIGDYCSKPN